MQGDITGLFQTNDVSKTQLDTGNVEMPTIVASVKDSGAIDVILENGIQDDHNMVVGHQDNCQVPKDKETKCDRVTQTDIISLSFSDVSDDAMPKRLVETSQGEYW